MSLTHRIFACLLACTMATASTDCTSMKPIRLNADPAAPPFGKVKAGDTVDVETRDGRRERFVVQQIDGDAIVSPSGLRYSSREITRLHRRSFSGWKTLALAGGVYVGAMVIVAALAVAALGSWE